MDFDFNNNTSDFHKHIPENTLVFTRITINSGGFFGAHNEYPDGLPTVRFNDESRNVKNMRSVYLDCYFTVLGGQYHDFVIFHLIGLYSQKSTVWAEMGRIFIRNILDSANGLDPLDDTPAAREKRKINTFKDLNGLCVPVKVGLETDRPVPRNIVKKIIQVTDPFYEKLVNYDTGSTNMARIADDDIPF